MILQVEHNSQRLPAAVAVRVRSPHLAMRYLDKALADKVERGLRIRRSVDKKTGMIYFTARHHEPITHTITLLRHSGYLVKIYPGKRCD